MQALQDAPAMRPIHILTLLLACSGCSSFATHATQAAAPRPPVADPGFPHGYRRWPTADSVVDEAGGEVRHLYRSPDAGPNSKGRFPDGAVLVKEHVVPAEDDVVVRIDVRRRLPRGTFDGWEYESFDPATRKRLQIDGDDCAMCHQAAPADGTFAGF